ncbi:unnamed protein product [Chironomus riparius]|uniref:Uncharacterized protein n=1 Tax=Chironomus riparius TaxID=315576 RepID=A0A9N9RNF7_9DIPT|nr:unnamed protein product [Chironomus riparius]
MYSSYLLLFSYILVQEYNGMFECILTQFEVVVKDSPYCNFNNLKIVRFNRTTFVINGSFEIFVDTIESFDTLCSMFKKAGNDYKLTPYKVGPINICDALKKDELFYPSIHAASKNFPALGTCDFTEGKIYKIINFLPNLDKVPPVFQSGDYMIECQVTKAGELIQALKIYGQLYNIDSNAMFECIMTQFDPIVKNCQSMNFDKIKVVRFNRTTLVSNGSFELNFDGSFAEAEGLCNFYKKAGNEYRLTPYKVARTNLCKGMAEDEYFYPAFHTFTNFPPVKTCAFKNGFTYFIKNYLPDLSKIPPVIGSGDYMLECKIFKGEEFIQGFKTYAQVYNIPNSG